MWGSGLNNNMKQYNEQELKCFDLVDQILEYCNTNNGGSYYNIRASEYSKERYYTYQLLVDHSLVIFRKGYEDKHSIFDVSPKGFDVIRIGGFKAYILLLDAAEEKKKLDAQKAAEKLDNDLWLSNRARNDYKRTRIIAYVGFGLSVLLGLFQIWKLLFGK
jgi:hypothetical protein